MGRYAPASKSKPTGRYSAGGGRYSPTVTTNEPSYEAQVEPSGASAFLDTAKTAGLGVIDLLSRPNYAIAGAVDELLQGKSPGEALTRAGSEILSGIGSIEGQKEGFGKVMEDVGVGAGFSIPVSEIAPFLFSDTGDEWLKLQRHGALDDVTGRGMLGLGLDIVTDPLTWWTGGAEKLAQLGAKTASKTGTKMLAEEFAKSIATKEAKVAGIQALKSIEPTLTSSQAIKMVGDVGGEGYKAMRSYAREQAEKAVLKAAELDPTLLKGPSKFSLIKSGVSDWVVEGLAGKPWGERVLAGTARFNRGVDHLATLFNVGWGARKIEGFLRDQTDLRNALTVQKAKWNEEIAAAANKFKLSKEAEKRVAIAVDEGTIQALQGAERDAALYIARKGEEIFDSDVAAGFRVKKAPHYLAHYYENLSPEDIKKLSVHKSHTYAQAGDLGRHLEERYFDTLREAEEWSARHAGDPMYPQLKPLYDPWESLRRRGEKSIEARTWRSWTADMANKYDTNALAVGSMDDAFDLSQRPARNISAAEMESIQKILNAPSKSILVPGIKLEKTVRTPEVRLAERQMANVVDSTPIEYIEKQTLKNLDEFRYYKRRGWDVVEEGDGKYVAYKLKEVTGKDFYSWKLKLERARNDMAGAIKRARRDVRVGTTRLPKMDKLAEVSKLSDEGKRAFFEERIAAIKSREELIATMNKYDKFREFFPRRLSYPELAPDGTPFELIQLKGMKEPRALPRSIANEIIGMDRRVFDLSTPQGQAFKAIRDGYDWLNNTFKLGVTAFPAFHFRNLYNNVAQSGLEIGMAALDPRNYRDAAALMMARDGIIRGPLGDYTLKELRDEFAKHGITIRGDVLREYTGAPSKGTAVRRGLEKAQRTVAGAVENEGRVMHAIAMIRKGKTPREAAESVNKALFDYSQLTDFERSVMKRVFPFYTWQRKNLEFMAKTIRDNPGRLANEIKPFRGRDEENRSLAGWDAGAFKVRLERDGKSLSVISGIDLPVRNLDLLWRGNSWKTLNAIMGMTSPVIKSPIEYGTGYSLFQNREFTRKESWLIGKTIEKMPRWAQDFTGYQKKMDPAGRPKYTFDGRNFYILFQSWAFSRLVSTSDRQFREYLKPGEEGVAAAMLDLATGLRRIDYDMNEEMRRRKQENERAAREALIRRGVLKEGSFTYVPR